MNDIAARRQETVVLETSVKAFSKSALVLLALAVAGTPARSRSLHIAGTAGYLSEWELDGEVAETGTGGELVGPLVWKHIGLCSVNGPQEKPGKISVKLSGIGSTSKIDATIFFDNARCPIAEAFRAARTGAWTVPMPARFHSRFQSSSRSHLCRAHGTARKDSPSDPKHPWNAADS